MLALLPLMLLSALVVGYAAALGRLRRRGDAWPRARTAALLGGCLCGAAALLPPLGTHDERLPVHMTQHLLLAMAAPALLALAAPVTIALRTLPPRPRRMLLGLVHSRLVGVLSTPPVVVVLSTGSLMLVYLTGLYAATLENEVLHVVVHLHLFLTGCLLSWTVVGLDPMPHRPGVRTRLVTLVLAAAAHDTVSKLLFARGLPRGGGPLSDRQSGAEIMYYGGTLVEAAVAVAVMTQWYRRSGRDLQRRRRRPTSSRTSSRTARAEQAARWQATPCSPPRGTSTRHARR